MSDFVIGIPIGIAIGLILGFIIGKKQKPWSELTEEEKKILKIAIGMGIVSLILGVILFSWLLLT